MGNAFEMEVLHVRWALPHTPASGRSRTRTCDRSYIRAVLYQLSYPSGSQGERSVLGEAYRPPGLPGQDRSFGGQTGDRTQSDVSAIHIASSHQLLPEGIVSPICLAYWSLTSWGANWCMTTFSALRLDTTSRTWNGLFALAEVARVRFELTT